jgi:hypothetical protein
MSAYNPNREGWGFASVVCLLTAGLAFTAYTIHNNTYRHPRDPMATQVYHDRDKAGAGHGEAAGPATHGPANAGDSTHGAAKPDSGGGH